MTTTPSSLSRRQGLRQVRVLGLALALSLGLAAIQSAPADAASTSTATNKDGKKYCNLENPQGGSSSVEHGQSITTSDPDGDGPAIPQTYWCNDGKWDSKKPEDARHSKPRRMSSAPMRMQRRH